MKTKIILLVSLLVAFYSCSHEEKISPKGITLYGYANTEENSTKTSFGTVSNSNVPFTWSKGDFIWVNGTKSVALTQSTDYAEFTFPAGGPTSIANQDLYYNLSGTGAKANVLSEQTLSGNSSADLGANGDFGYAATNSNGEFHLKHYTTYLWFNVYGYSTKALKSITVESDNCQIAGEAEFDKTTKSFGNISNASKAVTVTFANEITLTASQNNEIIAAATLLPNIKSGSKLTITYEFADGIFYSEKKEITKDLNAGTTYKVTTKIEASQLYTKAICTFEGDDFNALIDDPEMNGDLLYPADDSGYGWYDTATGICSYFTDGYFDGKFWGGGIAISNYKSTDIVGKGTSANQLTMYGTKAHSGNNFAITYGSKDIVGGAYGDTRPYIFAEGLTVFDCLWVNPTTYFLNSYLNGDGFAQAHKGDEFVKIVATGYKNEDDFNADYDGSNSDNKYPQVEMTFANGDYYISDWTKFDLSGLGEVLYIRINFVGSLRNEWGLLRPAYFAIDDLTIRKPIE